MNLNMIIYVTSTLLLAAEMIKQYNIFKGIVNQNKGIINNIFFLKHTQAIQDVDEFVSEQIWFGEI